MHDHAPPGYVCPFCRLTKQALAEDVARTVYHDDEITAFVSLHWWPNNPGHVLVVPNAHHENIYTLPPLLNARVHDCAQGIALALKRAYRCDGVSTRQHNEPAGGQDVWHYHLHVFPRYHGDALYTSSRQDTLAAERARYAGILRAELASWTPFAFENEESHRTL